LNHHHRKGLLAAGFTTIGKMLTGDLSTSGVKQEYLDAHLRFAQVITQSKETGNPEFFVFADPLTCETPLPRKSSEDLFVDFEWYTPLNSRQEFYYLLGVMSADSKMKQYVSESDVEERDNFFALISQIEEAIARDKSMHVYICSKAEITKSKALAARHGLDSNRLDSIIEHFVDLQEVASHSVAVSTGTYGLKAMEQFFRKGAPSKRITLTSDGASSLWQYHEYLASKDEGLFGDAKRIFDDIAAYNAKDCQSTRDYYDWLASI
jgi:uncharacterized protein